MLNLVVEIPLLWVPGLGESAMAVGTCVSFAVQALIMLWMLNRRIGGLGLSQTVIPVLKMMIATAVMAFACYGVQHVPGFPHGQTRIVWAVQLVLIVGVGAGVYLAMCGILGIDMLKQLRPQGSKSAET